MRGTFCKCRQSRSTGSLDVHRSLSSSDWSSEEGGVNAGPKDKCWQGNRLRRCVYGELEWKLKEAGGQSGASVHVRGVCARTVQGTVHALNRDLHNACCACGNDH